MNRIDLKHWSGMRLLRLIVAVGCIIAFFENHEAVILIIGIVVLIQAIFNIGCSNGACAIPSDGKQSCQKK